MRTQPTFAAIQVTDSKIESTQFGDIYFSPTNGVAESQHHFINANRLAERFDANKDFYIAETGFGTGLNFILALSLWRQINKSKSTLHYFSSEKFPIAPQMLQQLYQEQAEFSQFTDICQILIANYQIIGQNLTINFPHWRCKLTILIGDNSEVYQQLANNSSIEIDAWFLDGFAPSCNPEMWQPEFFQSLYQLSQFGTTVSSFTVASIVKKPLQELGFTLSKPKGFEYKREMLFAKLL